MEDSPPLHFASRQNLITLTTRVLFIVGLVVGLFLRANDINTTSLKGDDYVKFADQTGITELITLTKTALKPLEAFKNSVTDVNGIVKSNGSGGFSAAVAGRDYAAASHTHTTSQVEGLSDAIAKAEPFIVEVTLSSPTSWRQRIRRL